MKEVRTSMAKVQAEIRGLAAQVQDHPVYQELRSGNLSPERYQLLLWSLRQVHLAVERQAENTRADSVRAVRGKLSTKVPALERDLVAACGKHLVVPSLVNEPLDGFCTSMEKPTTPARMLGRLLLAEALLAGHAVLYSGFSTTPALPAGAGCYFALGHDAAQFQEICAAFAPGLVGEVPASNAYQAAQAMRGVLVATLDAVMRTTARRRSIPAERTA